MSECLDYKNKVSFQLHGAVSSDNIIDNNEESVIVSDPHSDTTEPHSHTTEPHSHTTEPHTTYYTTETHNQTLEPHSHTTEPHSHALIGQVTPTNDIPTNNIHTVPSSEATPTIPSSEATPTIPSSEATPTNDTPTNPFTEQYSNYDANSNFFVFPQNSNVTLDMPQSPSSPNHTPPRHSMFSLTRKSKHFVLEKCKMSDLQIPEGKHFQKRSIQYITMAGMHILLIQLSQATSVSVAHTCIMFLN